MRGKEVVKILERDGWVVRRINGSHHIMFKPGKGVVSVPVHASEIPTGTLRAIERATGVKMR